MADRIEVKRFERKRKYRPEDPTDLRFSTSTECLPVLGTKKQITKIVEQMDFTGYGCLYRIYNIIYLYVKHINLMIHKL